MAKQRLTTVASRIERQFDQVRRSTRRKLGWADPLQIVPYFGYGNRQRRWLRGRVQEDRGVDVPDVEEGAFENFHRMLRRYLSREKPGARLRITHLGRTHEVETDEEGYFECDFDLDGSGPQDPDDERWRSVELELLKPLKEEWGEVRARGRVQVPPPAAEHAVVSDIDDTILVTGATKLVSHVKTVLFNSAHGRTAFPGVPAFYRALVRGLDDRPVHPIFYVSSSPWNLYGLFESFMEIQDIPAGPIFLKDFGLEPGRWFKSGHGTHKVGWIERLMEAYPDLRFVLIGDSGQKDPEIYREIVESHPGRVAAVYWRDVSKSRRDVVQGIAEEIRSHDVEAVLAEDTYEAAKNAAELGLIREEALSEIRADVGN